MALPTALLVKGGVGVAAVATPVSTYFIIDGMNKKKLREENIELNKKITALGIADTTCHFEDIKDKAGCELDETKVKAINFTNKTNSDQSASASNTDKKIKLIIEKGYATGDFPEGLRFIFKNTSTETSGDVTIGSSSDSTQITLKKNTDYDFKIKTADDKSLKLEKAWTLKSLAEKVGISCTTNETTECCTTETSLNVWKGETNYKTGATVEKGKKITVAKETEGYLEGFKFTVGEESDINLTGGTDVGATIDKLTKNNMSYEIALKDDNGTKTWFLVEKPTASSVPQESQ